MKIPCGKSVVLIHILAFASFVSAQSPPVREEAVSKIGTATVESKSVEDDAAKKSVGMSFDKPNLTRLGVEPGRVVSLTLDEAIRRALQSNNNIEISRDDVRFQETQVRSILGSYDPVFTAVPTYTRNSTTGSQATSDFTANTSVDQLLRTGGRYTAFFNNFRTENAFNQAQVSSGSISNGTSAIYSSSLGFRYTQPLWRNLKVDNARRNLRIAQRRLQQTDAEFRTQAIDTISRVQRSYWDLVFALKDQQNRVANMNLAQENLRQVEARIAAGAAAPLARAEVATELASREGDVLLATQQVGIAENALKQLVLRDAVATEWAEAWLPTDQPTTISATPINMDEAIKDAMDNRNELRRLKFVQDINNIDIAYFKNQTKPQIDLNTTFSLDGIAQGGTNEAITTNLFTSVGDLALLNGINQVRVLPSIGLAPVANPTIVIPPRPEFLFGGFGRSWSNMFRSDAPNYSVGVTISFPFRNKTAKANLAGAVIKNNQIDSQIRAEEQVVIVEVRNAVQAVETARQRVLTSRRARVNAEIQLEGERKLYDAGRSTTFILFQRENALANAKNAEIRAETDYSKALADLHRATSTTFRVNNIDVATPTNDK